MTKNIQTKKSYTRGPDRPQRGQRIEVRYAIDETEAYNTLKRIKRRAQEEHEELKHKNSPRFTPTLPKFNLPE